MITIYGIKNCDSVKKARRWMDARELPYTFHDFRVDGITEKQISLWVKKLGWEAILNRRSTTWKKLGADEKVATSEKNSVALMAKYPTLIKRPIVIAGNVYIAGFSDEEFSKKFAG